MAEPAAESPPPVAADGDKFGPPHAQAVSETLQFWILLPGILLLMAFVGRLLILKNTKTESAKGTWSEKV